MKSKLSDYMPLAAIAAGVLLLRNKSGVSGIGATNTWRALDMIEQAGMDINQDFFTLTYDQISELVHIMKKCGYRAPDARYRAGSPARYFWYFMQRVNDRPVNGISGVGVLSKYIITWVEVYSPDGIITKSDERKLGGYRETPSNKYMYLPFPNKAAAYGYIDRMQNAGLDKTYECRLLSDRQFELRDKNNEYKVPFTTKQQESVFFI